MMNARFRSGLTKLNATAGCTLSLGVHLAYSPTLRPTQGEIVSQ